MKTKLLIVAEMILAILYVATNPTSAGILLAALLIVLNAGLLVLHAKGFHNALTTLASGLTGLLWIGSPTGLIIMTIPVVFTLFGGLRADVNKIYTISVVERVSAILYTGLTYFVYISVNGFNPTDLIPFGASVLLVTYFAERFHRDSRQIRHSLLVEKVLAVHDNLTGLLNRQTMERDITAQANTIESFSVIMADIDFFKKVNDQFGHLQGDVILKDLADTMEKTIRGSDKAYRYGGEEFLIMCPGTNVVGAEMLAERLRENFSAKAYELNGEIHHFTVSLGVVECKFGEFTTVKDLIDKADNALYQSKKNGRNRTTVYKEDMA